MLSILFVASFILIVNHHHVNCDKDEPIVIEIPKGDFEIEANVMISLSANKMVNQVSNWSISEMISIDSEENAIGLTEIVSSHAENQMVTIFHRFNGNISNHLIVKENYCVDFTNFTDSTGHFGWFDNILLKGIYYFYQLILKHHEKLTVSMIKVRIKPNAHISLSTTVTRVGLNLKKTGIHNSTVILNFKGSGPGSVRLSNLDSIILHLADDDITHEAQLSSIIVKNVSSHKKIIQPTINLDCPYYYHEDKKFPGHFMLQDYRVHFTEISTYPAIGLQVKSEFIISTLEEISLIKRFQWKHSLELFNDYRLGVKYILDDSANETVNCAVEPISVDSTSLTNGPLSFDEIAWMNLPYKYVGQFMTNWESKNVTLDVWKAVETNITVNKSVYAKVITTIYMINKILHDKMFNVTTKYEDTFNGYILTSVKKDLYPMFGSQSKPNSRIRKFKNFTRQINDNDIVSSTLTIGKQFIDHCYDSKKKIDNITINLKIAQIDNPNSNGTVITRNQFGIKRSLSRIIVNLLDVSLLRIVSMNVIVESEIYFRVAVEIVEAVDLTGLHRKNYRQYDWDTLRNYETINVLDDDDCLRIQAERPNTSYVISCNSPNNNLCTRFSSGQSLPSESLTGSSCLVYNNSHDTLISFVKEAPLINLIKPSFTLRGIKFLANNSHYKIVDAWTSGHEKIPEQPELIKKQFYDKKKATKSFNISKITNNKDHKPRAVHDHSYRHWILIGLLMTSLGLMLAFFAQRVYNKSRYLEPDFVSLTLFNK